MHTDFGPNVLQFSVGQIAFLFSYLPPIASRFLQKCQRGKVKKSELFGQFFQKLHLCAKYSESNKQIKTNFFSLWRCSRLKLEFVCSPISPFNSRAWWHAFNMPENNGAKPQWYWQRKWFQRTSQKWRQKSFVENVWVCWRNFRKNISDSPQ